VCINLHQTGFVGKGSDHLQLIKFWPSCAPEKGVCGGAKIFGSALLQPEHSFCVSLGTNFIIIITTTITAIVIINPLSNEKMFCVCVTASTYMTRVATYVDIPFTKSSILELDQRQSLQSARTAMLNTNGHGVANTVLYDCCNNIHQHTLTHS